MYGWISQTAGPEIKEKLYQLIFLSFSTYFKVINNCKNSDLIEHWRMILFSYTKVKILHFSTLFSLNGKDLSYGRSDIWWVVRQGGIVEFCLDVIYGPPHTQRHSCCCTRNRFSIHFGTNSLNSDYIIIFYWHCGVPLLWFVFFFL